MALYMQDKNNYTEVLNLLNDAQYIAEFAKNNTAKIVNEYAKGTVDFGEGSKNTALMHFESAKISQLHQVMSFL